MHRKPLPERIMHYRFMMALLFSMQNEFGLDHESFNNAEKLLAKENGLTDKSIFRIKTCYLTPSE